MPQEPVPAEPVLPGNAASLWLAEELSRQLTRAVDSMTGESVRITFAPHQLVPAEIEPSEQELLWWEQPLSPGPDLTIWVAAASRSWEEIGNRVLRSAGVNDATPEDIRST